MLNTWMVKIPASIIGSDGCASNIKSCIPTKKEATGSLKVATVYMTGTLYV